MQITPTFSNYRYIIIMYTFIYIIIGTGTYVKGPLLAL